MNFDWVKAPKNKEEEKEQFDKLYHMLVRLSKKGEEEIKEIQEIQEIQEKQEIHKPLNEFMQLRLDILENFKGQNGTAIPALVTCKGCNSSFYSETERQRHFQQAPACAEWTRRGLVRSSEMDVPFLPMMEQALSTLLGPDYKSCRFCQKAIATKKAQEKHYSQAPLCNRLAHDTFRSWFQTQMVLAPVAPSSAGSD